jgi:hypothetical protein
MTPSARPGPRRLHHAVLSSVGFLTQDLWGLQFGLCCIERYFPYRPPCMQDNQESSLSSGGSQTEWARWAGIRDPTKGQRVYLLS